MDERFGQLLALALEETTSIQEAAVAACIAYEMPPIDAHFGMDAQGFWHGPTPPGPDWVVVRQGQHGGKIWQNQGGKQPQAPHPQRAPIPTPTPQATPPPTPVQTPEQRQQRVAESASKNPIISETVKPSLPKMTDNYKKPLSTYTPTLYRETDVANAIAMFPNTTMGAGQPQDFYFANTADLALGQGTNTGVMMEFDSGDIEGQVNLSKPGAPAAYEQGQAEFITRQHRPGDFQKNLRSIEVRPNAAGTRGDKGLMNTLLTRLTQEGWKKESTPSGAVKYSRPQQQPSSGAAFALDVFDLKAQGVLNRAVEASRKLSAQARRDLKAALALENPDAILHAVVAFLGRYRVQIARLLTVTQLAALMEGAQEIASHLPVIPPQGLENLPPSLGPREAVELLERIQRLPPMERDQAIYALPPEQQRYVRQGIDVNLNPPPPITLTAPPVGSPERVQWPVLEEALRSLSEKNAVTRAEFDRLSAAARQKAFTITGIDSTATIAKFRDALAESLHAPDLAEFRKTIAADMETAGFLSDPHLELVYRNAIQTAFSDGQMRVLSHPFVRSGFPYVARDAIHDDRVRKTHLDLEKLGIQETNVYRTDDPVWQRFRSPWADNCRCADTFMTVQQAAERGIEEAQTWLSSGIEPEQKAWVKMPDFAPDSRFDRLPTSAPLSVQLSVVPMEALAAVPAMADDKHEETDASIDQAVSVSEPDPYDNYDAPKKKPKRSRKGNKRRRRRLGKRLRSPEEWRVLAGGMAFSTDAPGPGWVSAGDGKWVRGAMFGMDAQGNWHGPQPPGPDWQQVGKGPSGGLIWRRGADSSPQQARVRPGAASQQIAKMVQAGDIDAARQLWGTVPKEQKVAIANSLPPDVKQKLLQPAQPQETPQQRDTRVAASAAANPIIAQNVPSDFGTEIMQIAQAMPPQQTSERQRGSHFGDTKVFIANLYDTYRKAHPQTTRDQFNQMLLQANREGKIQLGRADLVQLMHPEDVSGSEIKHENAEFHFLNMPRRGS